MQQTNNSQQFKTRINQFIRVPQVRVILADGTNAGIMDTRIALRMAQDQGLDLVEISPTARPPVAKIIDYGKLKYEEKKKAQAAKKNQQVQELKELTLRPNIDVGDLDHKLAQAKSFLLEGNKLKLTMRFRGREIVHADLGKEKLQWMFKQLEDLAAPNPQVSLEGKIMSMLLLPAKKQ